MSEPRRNVRVSRLHEQGKETDLEGTTPSERISMMWQLALDAWAFKGKTLLNPDFRDILCAFSEENVEYLLVGAYALAAHGQVRATGDIDLWVRDSADNAARIMDAGA